jgi:DNA-binding response OmpR family regulator
MVGQKTVLLALGKDTSGESVREFLRQMHVVLVECSDGIDALRKALSKDMDLILLDTDLSRLNGYQCARMIKADPTMGSSVIVHMGHSDNPIDQYWSRICGGDAYLKIPVSESDLTGMMRQFSGRKR